ncbi:MAG TPA: TIGR03790 family protein [Bryobacteraceae bacterium]|nr:TIGR03790 family protein [Bryobacteraceae bacterium]
MALRIVWLLFLPVLLLAQAPDSVLIVINQPSALSRKIGEYYAERRHVPAANICRLNAPVDEEISRSDFDGQVSRPIQSFLRSRKLTEKILYIVTTMGVPLKVRGHGGITGDAASVDSELTLLYSDMHGHPHALPAGIRNPFFGQINAPFRHPDFPIYLVTRLAGFDFSDVKGIIDRALVARNRGKFVIDLKASDNTPGNTWLLQAAQQLPRDRVVLDRSATVLEHESDVIGYASWGSNDPDRKQRHLDFHWLPGAIMTEYVSTNARTFARPPDSWNIGAWGNAKATFAGSPQTLTADYIHDGVTGASGHVYEPYLAFTPRPNILLPAYYRGRNLAESYYLAIPVLSWENVVIGDPLCRLGKP